jgi:hypothetical protein
VPFRLLGLVAHPDEAAELCGHTVACYAASGTDVTLVCAASRGQRGADLKPAMRRLGVRDLVLLDFTAADLSTAVLEDLFADVMASLRPHIVMADGTQDAIRGAASSAFSRVRRLAGGSSALPAKLYFRYSSASPLVSVTTSIAVPAGAPAEHFVRAFPDPWVTGVLERDLFAGVAVDEPARPELDQRLAG